MMSDVTTNELIENFSLFDDWEDRYRYIIELGDQLPDMPEIYKSDENKVQGCMSQVWMHLQKDDQGRFDFLADSDAMIVKGLIAILKIIYAHKNQADIQDININGIFTELGLDQHLSPNRRNGFYAMVERIKKLSI